MKKIFSIFSKSVLFIKISNGFTTLVMVLKTLLDLLLGRTTSEEEYAFDISNKVLNNVIAKIDVLDEGFAGLFEQIKNTALTKQEDNIKVDSLLKEYILCYRCLEALRIIFIYSSSLSEFRKRIEKSQDIIESRVKYIDTKAWLSILKHNSNYGNSKTDILNSQLITIFL